MKRTKNGPARTVKRARKTGPVSFKTALKRASATRETKHVDWLATAGANLYDTTGYIELVNPTPEGTGPDERIGKKLLLKSLQCRGIFRNGTGVNRNSLIIVYDKKPREALPLISQILESVSSIAMNNDSETSRFNILKRLDWASAPDGGNGANSAMAIDFFLDLKGLPMEYNNAAGGQIANIEEGAIYYVTVGDNAQGAATGTGELNFRTRFVDI